MYQDVQGESEDLQGGRARIFRGNSAEQGCFSRGVCVDIGRGDSAMYFRLLWRMRVVRETAGRGFFAVAKNRATREVGAVVRRSRVTRARENFRNHPEFLRFSVSVTILVLLVFPLVLVHPTGLLASLDFRDF